MSRLQVVLYAALIAGLAAGGCGRPGGTVTQVRSVNASDLPSGWSRAEAGDGSVSLGLAPDWQIYNPSKEAFTQRLKDIAAKNPNFKGDAAARAAGNNTFKLMFRRGDATGFHEIGNVLEIPVHSSQSLDELTEANAASSRRQGIAVQITSADLKAGAASQMDYEKPSAATGRMMHHLSYYFLVNRTLVLLHFEWPTGDGRAQSDAHRMADTFRIQG